MAILNGLCDDNFKTPTKVYDVEKKELIGAFESRTAAAEFLGINTGALTSAYRNKSKIYKNKLGITVCVR